jgi:hypothetical protein
LFADDTSLGYASQDEDQIKYVINHDLHELGDWSKKWLMSFNPDKTEIMLFKNVENSTRTDPWGTPADTDTYEDDESLFTTFWCLQYK